MSIENAPPPIPEKTGDSVKDSQALHAWDAAVRAHFEGRGPSNPDPHNNISQFDADMRAAGTQRTDTPSGSVDQTALTFLQDWRAANPKATVEQLRVYERDLASVLAGRRMHESLGAFHERTAAAHPAAQPAAPAPVDLDPEIYRPVSEVAAEHLHGYTMPTGLAAGLHVDVGMLSEQLEAARSAGISDAQVQYVIRAMAAKAV